jgi:hypothetical protein
VPAEQPTDVFELLLQEPTAKVTGAQTREMPAVSTEGRVFRRFLVNNLPATAVMQIDVPRLIGVEREKVYAGVGVACVFAMTIALVFAARRPTSWASLAARAARPPARVDVLLRAIADLDADFERRSPAADTMRTHYEAQRAALKSELAEALAAIRRPE